MLIILVILNIFVIEKIDVQKIEWSELFPKKEQQLPLQYLFCHTDGQTPLTQQTRQLLQKDLLVDAKKNIHLLLFDANRSKQLLHTLQCKARSGTVLVKEMLFEDFYKEIHFYTLYILPMTLLVLLFIIPLRLWLDILLEMALYTLLLMSVLKLSSFVINVASLLALLFLVIYSLTLINYIYSQKMDIKRLSFGIQISIIATIVSALFLLVSQFGLIHSFGAMLLVGLVVLYIYMTFRIYFIHYYEHRGHAYYFDVVYIAAFVQKYKFFFASFMLLLILGVMMQYKNLSVDLNIVNSLDTRAQTLQNVKKFEKYYIPSLLFVVEVEAKKSSFHNEVVVKKLIHLQTVLEKIIPGKILISIPTAFRKFKGMAKEQENPHLLAQFLLAYSFMHHDMELFSKDMKKSFIIAGVPMTLSSEQFIQLKNRIETLGKTQKDFSLHVRGKIADFDAFIKIFFQEIFTGILVTLLLTSLFFLFYCKNLFSSFVVVLSVVFSFSLLIASHILLHRPLTIATLMSVILYGGLVADSFIQLFICYKTKDFSCESSVLNPIFISNISILAFLFGMIFVGGLLGSFAFDMFILLGANLLFLLVFVPLLYKHYLKAYSDL